MQKSGTNVHPSFTKGASKSPAFAQGPCWSGSFGMCPIYRPLSVSGFTTQ